MGILQRELDKIFNAHGNVSANDAKRVSIGTFHLRKKNLSHMFEQLRSGTLVRCEDGKLVNERPFKLKSPRNLKMKHVHALINDWLARNLSVSYVQNMLSLLRIFCVWIGKAGMIGPTEVMIADPRYHRRQLAAVRDKTWEGCGVDVEKVLADMSQKYERVAMSSELQLTFSLRMKEAALLQPWLADQTTYLDISRGTKGGRSRTHNITTDKEREVLERAKKLIPERNECLIPRNKTFVQWKNHVYYVLAKKYGISIKVCGTSTHGLRAQGLNYCFTKITGKKSPICGGQPGDVEPAMDRFARRQVAETAGHRRSAVASAYLGPVLRRKKKEATPADNSTTPESPEAMANADSQAKDTSGTDE